MSWLSPSTVPNEFYQSAGETKTPKILFLWKETNTQRLPSLEGAFHRVQGEAEKSDYDRPNSVHCTDSF